MMFVLIPQAKELLQEKNELLSKYQRLEVCEGRTEAASRISSYLTESLHAIETLDWYSTQLSWGEEEATQTSSTRDWASLQVSLRNLLKILWFRGLACPAHQAQTSRDLPNNLNEHLSNSAIHACRTSNGLQSGRLLRWWWGWWLRGTRLRWWRRWWVASSEVTEASK